MKIEALLDTPAILANRAAPVHLVVKFTAPPLGNTRPQPIAFAAVIDRSGSMAGSPLHAAREAAKTLVRNLRTGDQFALTVFDDEAQTIVPLQAITQREPVLRAIDAITDGASTNLTAGWMLGRDELAKAPAGTVRRLLLLSDGQLNQGVVDPAMVRQVVAKGLEQQGVRTACLGLGDGYNEDLMAELARCTNGAFYDANSPEKLPEIFAAELDGLQRIVVQNLRLRVGRLDFCEALGLLSEYPTITLPDGRHEIAVGDLVSEEERMLVFGLEVLPLPLLPDGRLVTNLEGELLLSLEAVFDEIGPDGISSHTWSQTVKVVSVQEPGQVRTNTEVIPWVAAQRAGKAVADALRASDSGDLPKARSVLESEIRKLGEMGSDEATAEGLSMVRDTLTRLEEHGTFEGGDRKRRLYSSRSMQRMSSAETWCSEDPAPSFKKPRRGSSQPPPPAPPVA